MYNLRGSNGGAIKRLVGHPKNLRNTNTEFRLRTPSKKTILNNAHKTFELHSISNKVDWFN